MCHYRLPTVLPFAILPTLYRTLSEHSMWTTSSRASPLLAEFFMGISSQGDQFIGLSPIEAGQPLSPATRHRLGEPVPHQQADRDKASPQAPEGFAPHKVEIMQGYPPFRVAILHLRASSLLLLSRLPLLLRAARLACVRHTANVNPEPGSNSPCNV